MKKAVLMASLTLAISYSSLSYGEVVLLDRNNGTDYLNNFRLSISGVAEIGYKNQMGNIDNGSYMHRGYADNSEYSVMAEYFINDHWKIISRYTVGASLFKAAGWNRHTSRNRDGGDDTQQYLAYAGVESDQYGTLTYGKQFSLFYTVLGSKTDLWINDMAGQSAALGVNGSYDGSYRGKDLLHYSKTFGPVTLYAGWILPAHDYYLNNGIYERYSRKSGEAVGINYQIQDDLAVGAVYSRNKAIVRTFSDGQENYTQQQAGIAVQWTPNNWTLAALFGHYKNFVPFSSHNEIRPSHSYFDKSASGWEYFLAYKMPAHYYFINSIEPYYGVNAARWSDGYQTNDQTVAARAYLKYNLMFALEHTFVNTSAHDPDVTRMRLTYVF